MARCSLCDVGHSAEAFEDVPNCGAWNLSEVAMTDGVAGLDKIDESIMTCDLADEALEAAARVDGVRAITFGYCATASTSWYCLPN
jgi:hypothetical protein